MNELTNIRSWLMQCPSMQNLFIISAEGNDGKNLITPFSSSSLVTLEERTDVTGSYTADIVPLESIYEEYQIDCFRMANPEENDCNIMNYDEVRSVCDWIEEQNALKNFPDIGKQIVRVEPKPFLPSVRFREIETGLVGYFFTMRITYVNPTQRQMIEYAEQ